MSTIIVADLAPAIRAEHEAAQTSARQAVAHAIRAGELLLQAKAALPHGEFGPWLTANVEFSERTAQGYMRLARECADPTKAQRVADLSLRGALHQVRAEAVEARRREWLQGREQAATATRESTIPPSGRFSDFDLDGQPVRVKHESGDKWAVRIWPNAVGEKLNPIAWARAADDAQKLPAFDELRKDISTAKREVKFLEHELRAAQERERSAGRALRAASYRYLEQVHGVPRWGSWHWLRIPEEMTETLLNLAQDEFDDEAPAFIQYCHGTVTDRTVGSISEPEMTMAAFTGDIGYLLADKGAAS